MSTERIQDITDDQLDNLRYRATEEGFDYCFDGYSKWSEIKDARFHELRLDYLRAKKALASYIR